MRPEYVYRLYAEDGELLYVGRSCDVEDRLYYHTALWSRSDPRIRQRLAYWTCWRYSIADAEVVERNTIWFEEPLCNRQYLLPNDRHPSFQPLAEQHPERLEVARRHGWRPRASAHSP